FISGQVKRRTMMESFDTKVRQLGDQEVDIISVVKPLTKYAVTVTEPNEIKYHLDRAVYEATNGRFAPVWLNIPIDVQASIIDDEDLKEFESEPRLEYDLQLDEIMTRLKSAKRPLVVAGHGIRLAGAVDEFRALTEILRVPVVTTFNGFDLLGSDNPCYVGRIGTIGQRAANAILQKADVVLFLGTRNNIRQVSYNWENFAKDAFKIVVDIDKAELDKPLVVPDLKVCADLKELVARLKERAISLQSDWLMGCKRLKDKFDFSVYQERRQDEEVIEPYHFTYALSECLAEKDIVVMSNGSACVCPFQNAVVKEGQRWILNSGNASMGYGIAASVGVGAWVKDNSKDCRVVCLEGDGSIMMNIQELETIKHNQLSVKIFVINNSGYASIRQTQRNFFEGRMTGCGLESGVSVPDFVKVAEAFGLKSMRIQNPKTMRDEILRALNTEGALLCEVVVESEYDFMPKLASKKLEDGTMISPSLEDMYPFLDKKELELDISENVK
ncbi:thiamine pyrophosphate-binding protein, partial [bacterium]|nr:thiamine pyrophosphate-binding protein [bacterium]